MTEPSIPTDKPLQPQLETEDILPPPQAKHPLGKRIRRWALFFLGAVVVLIFAYRWAGTSTVRGTVQRVYEKDARFRIEFVDSSGEVLVVENEVIRFPHFKTDTEDLQAELHHLSETGDIVDLTTWGFRASWFSVFPNAIDAEFVRSNHALEQQRVEHITQVVIDELIDQGIATRGPGSERMRPGLTEAVKKGMSEPLGDPQGAHPAAEE